MQALPQESGAGVSSTRSSDPPIPLTPTSSLTTSLRRLIGWLPGASMTMVHLEKESSPILACRMKRWQRRKGKAGRGRGRGSVIIVVDLATGHASVDNQRKINLQITKISLSHWDSPASSKHNCYVRVERSARLEQAGYDQVALPVVNGAYASGTR